MTNRFAKLEERLARLEEAQTVREGRFVSGKIIVEETDPLKDLYIEAEHERLVRSLGKPRPGDRVLLIANVIVESPYRINERHTENLSGNERRDH